jgi:hypothetical protein
MEQVIGSYTLTEPTDFTKRYEVAAWYKTIRVPAGTYDVLAEVGADGRVRDWPGPVVRLAGVVTESFFPALFGGVAYSSGSRPRDVGVEDYVYVRPYAHNLAWSLIQGDETRFALGDGFVAEVIHFESQGKEYKTAGIFRRPDPVDVDHNMVEHDPDDPNYMGDPDFHMRMD